MPYTPATPNPHLTRSWSRCRAALFPDPTLPPKQWEHNIAGFLFERGYAPESIRLTLDHLAIFGTAMNCAELSFSALDRREVDRRMPGRPVVWPPVDTTEMAEFGPAFI